MIKVLRCDYPVLHSFSIKLGSQSPIVRLPDTGTFTTTRSDGDLVPYPPLYPWHGDLPSRLTSFRLSYTRFDVRGVFWNTASTSCRVRIAPLLETLRACSNLEELVLDRSVEGSRIIDTPSSIPPPFTLPRLTKVSMIDLDVPTVNTILGTLLLPRCEFLNIRCDMRRYGFNDLADQQALDLISSMVKHTKVVSIEEVYGEMLQFAYQHHPDELLESGVFFSLSNVLDKPYFVERFLNLVPATSISSIRIGIRTLDILLVIETVSHLVEDLTIINRDPHIWEEAIEFLIASVRTGNWGKLTSFTAISSPNWDFQVDDFIRFLDAWADSRSGDAETRPKFKKLHIVGGLKNLREYGVDAFRRRVETLKVRDLIY
ncbi:hypothetical protein FRB99_001480 [Tulasnella sp. 403]|nr:hypothetical protein FRB99_001480 [Tulasnella sp. 403]